jgi:hypothetical protein
MFVLCCFAILIIVFVFAIFFTVGLLGSATIYLQEDLQTAGLTATSQISAYDRVGKINNLVADSRQLVFNDRQAGHYALVNCKPLQEITDQFTNESLAGAKLVKAQHDLLADEIISKLYKLARDQNNSNLSKSNHLPFLHLSKPQILNFELGDTGSLVSSVPASDANEELLEYDLTNKFVESKSHLYFGRKSLKLPPPDDNLEFTLTALPPLVCGKPVYSAWMPDQKFNTYTSIVQNGKTVKTKSAYIPSAVRIQSIMPVDSTILGFKSVLKASATSHSASGLLEP